MKDRIAIIGGGAAGVFCAAYLGRLEFDCSNLFLFEGSSQILKKVSLSGGGRCNFTNAKIGENNLENFYPRGARNLKFPVKNFLPQDAVNFFERLGVKSKEEDCGRIFPLSGNSSDIIKALEGGARKCGVKICVNKKIIALNLNADKNFEVNFSDGGIETFKSLIFAVGGNWYPPLKKSLENIGVKFTEEIPSLFALKLESGCLDKFSNLQGCVFKDVEIHPRGALEQKIKNPKKFSEKIRGDLLATHFGLGGPAILKFSSFFARELFELNYNCDISLNLIPKFKTCSREIFEKARRENPRSEVKNFPQFALPQKFWKQLFNGKTSKTFANFGKKDENEILNLLENFPLKISGKSTHKAEFVTCGGVENSQIDFSSMEHRQIKRLYFLGECLNIDGITGGFNLHAAFATAKMCAISLSKGKST